MVTRRELFIEAQNNVDIPGALASTDLISVSSKQRNTDSVPMSEHVYNQQAKRVFPSCCPARS